MSATKLKSSSPLSAAGAVSAQSVALVPVVVGARIQSSCRYVHVSESGDTRPVPALLRSAAQRRCLVWLLAFLVPLQALAGGVLAASGVSHTHKEAACAPLVLEDFRRSPVRRHPLETHVASAFGHFHASEAVQRHHHAAGDATVVVEGRHLLHPDDGDDMTISPSLGVFVGLISAAPSATDVSASNVPTAHPRWTPQTHDPALPERPPRTG